MTPVAQHLAITPQEALQRTIEHREIFHDEMLHLMRMIMRGELSPVLCAAILTGLRVKKETIGEISGRRAGDARVFQQGARCATKRTWSISSAPAAMGRTPSTSPPAPCLSLPPPGPRSASTAGAA